MGEVAEEAIKALISLDAQRLEDLADCCEALNRGREGDAHSWAPRSDSSLLPGKIRILERMLYETRANLTVFTRLHRMRIRSISGIVRLEERESYGDN